MSSANLISSIFSAVSQNEVSGNGALAGSIKKPLNSGTGGWTIGYLQEDFNPSNKNQTQAQNILTSALTASGKFDSTNATIIAQVLSNAGTYSNVNFSGITDSSGNAVTITSINAAFQTTAASRQIYTASLNDFYSQYNSMNSTLQNASLNTAVLSALADPTQGAFLETVLADYNNQYHLSASGNMMQLLTTGSATFNGNTVTLNTSNAATVTQSVMQAELDTKWASSGNGTVACTRLANDMAAANSYDAAQGLTPISASETLSSAYGVCTITPNANGTSFTGTWSSGSFSGNSSQSANNYQTITNNANGTSSTDTFTSGGPIEEQICTFTNPSGTGASTSLIAYLAPTLV